MITDASMPIFFWLPLITSSFHCLISGFLISSSAGASRLIFTICADVLLDAARMLIIFIFSP